MHNEEAANFESGAPSNQLEFARGRHLQILCRTLRNASAAGGLGYTIGHSQFRRNCISSSARAASDSFLPEAFLTVVISIGNTLRPKHCAKRKGTLTRTERRRCPCGAMAAVERAPGCYKCGQTGHWASQCTVPPDQWIPQSSRPQPAGAAGAQGGTQQRSTQQVCKRTTQPPACHTICNDQRASTCLNCYVGPPSEGMNN